MFDKQVKTLSERLNFCFNQKESPDYAIKIDPKKDLNYAETICLYCADNNIDLNEISDSDFDSAVIILSDSSNAYISQDPFYFWID